MDACQISIRGQTCAAQIGKTERVLIFKKQTKLFPELK